MRPIARLTAIFLAVSLLFGSSLHAASGEIKPLDYASYADRLISSSYTDDAGCTLPYLLYLPEDYDERACPIILSLHGAGERGTDNTKQAQCGILPYILADDASATEAIILMPQCPEDGQWVDVPWSIGVYFTEDVPESPYLACAVSLMLATADAYGADTTRLYATGYSMGGYGTWDILARYPTLLAAALPLCGGGDFSKASLYRDTPIKTYHCTEDGIVPFIGTQAIVSGIEAIGGQLIDLVAIESTSHDAWTPAYSDPETLGWLLSQKKKTHDAQENESTSAPEHDMLVNTDESFVTEAESKNENTDESAGNSEGKGVVIALGAFLMTAALLSCAVLFRREAFYS